ncbi:hypothetical protein HETIRDRAFT_306133 [Heterobasidion irregulare TC 32-1]|uniref:Transmembrane protein n=1 Tax=Heterobasidion irregulare (strain TC 32-1) TaxID=747525 RepID=W4KQD9_HETIT|nr:uncharacterized protein HETIRDRAFT_306133 [Heterobasidion irregulare TC 32-1]ETW87266.1 hypothetical protein HETIRDRAFT_306133 [Heterobasidion irregulare TC 32-1]
MNFLRPFTAFPGVQSIVRVEYKSSLLLVPRYPTLDVHFFYSCARVTLSHSLTFIPTMFVPLRARYPDDDMCSSTDAACTATPTSAAPSEAATSAATPSAIPVEQKIGQRNFTGVIIIIVIVFVGILLWIMFSRGAAAKRVRRLCRRKESALPARTVVQVVRSVESDDQLSETKEAAKSTSDKRKSRAPKVRLSSLLPERHAAEPGVQDVSDSSEPKSKMWESKRSRQ